MTIVTDESSYVFQAYNFLEGRIRRPYPPVPSQISSEMIICDAKVGWMSRYPPGHPLWLVPGALLGDARIMSSVAAAVAMLLLAGLARRLNVSRRWICGLALLSPFFLFMYGTLMSHTSGFVATAGLLLFYLRWQESGRPMEAAGAGLFWSWLFLNRTYTALLIAAPFGVDALLYLFRHRRERQAWMGVISFAGCAGVGILVYLAYNAATVGDPFVPTYLFYGPDERLGFGMRATHGRPVHHTLAKGLGYLWRNIRFLDHWALGFHGSLVVLLALAGVGWNRRWSFLLLAAPLAVWVGYVYFWYEGVVTVGPVYYFESLLFLLVAAGLGMERLRQVIRQRLSRPWRYAVCMGALALVAALSFGFSWRKGCRLRDVWSYDGRVLELIDSLPPRSLVMIENVRNGDVIFNLRGLETDPLRVRGCGPCNPLIAGRFPDRKPFVLDGGLLTVAPIAIERPFRMELSSLSHCAEVGRNGKTVADVEARMADPSDRPGMLVWGRYYILAPGSYRVAFDAVVTGAHRDAPVVFELAAARGTRILGSRAIEDTREPVVFDIDVDGFLEVEPRIRYNGAGSVSVQDIVIAESEKH
jgi:hypothetical protein